MKENTESKNEKITFKHSIFFQIEKNYSMRVLFLS